MRNWLLIGLIVLVGPAFVDAATTITLDLRAAAVTVSQNGQVIEARGGVRITDGRTRLQADQALYAVRDRRLALTGNVAVISPDGTLNAQHAEIRLSSGTRIDRVEAWSAVELETKDRVLKADRVTYTIGSEQITASGHVSLFIPPDIIVSGQDLIVQGRQSAVLTGGARVQNRDGYIQGERIEFVERDQIAYVRGNVVSEVQDTKITAATASFYGKERKAIFRDGVTVMRPGRTLRAEVVTVYYQERRIVAEGETTIHLEEERQGP